MATPAPVTPLNRALIDELLDQQRDLSAVNRFSHWHEHQARPPAAGLYRDLVPLTRPRPGEQYAFEVNLDLCSGCKSCVSACHSLNGLDDEEMWRSVGVLVTGGNDECRTTNDECRPKPDARDSDFDPHSSFVIRHSSSRFQQHITTACHHCVDPGCLNGCPVLAYDKDPVTGIVRHLDDQCIGCQYCVMKCPYDVPKYSSKRGIVRKCDLCAGRLAVGEAPACAQACPNEAIRITLVETRAVRNNFRNGNSRGENSPIPNGFLPDSPSPGITLPTTRYKSARPLPANLLAGDHARVTPSASHLPLVFMLVLTQLAVGAGVAAVFLEPAKWLWRVAFTVSALALGIASLHLGRPLKAWRAFLGWRTSWFSREVIVFGTFVPLAAAAALATGPTALLPALKGVAAAVGLLGVACSAMIYADTGREFWRASQCLGKFLGTTLLLGTATALAVQAFAPLATPFVVPGALLLITGTTVKLGFEHRILRHRMDENVPTPRLTPLNRTALLLAGELGLAARARVACAILGGGVVPLLLVASAGGNGLPVAPLCLMALAFCTAGELLERYLFFIAVAPVKMPGAVAA